MSRSGRSLWMAGVLGLGLAGCETGSRVLLGGSLAKGRLYQAAEEKVLALDKATSPECEARVIASVRVIDRPASAATDYDRMYSVGLPDVSRGLQTPATSPSPASTVSDRFTERWTVDRCGQRISYRVSFSPGDIIEVVPESQPRPPSMP